MKKKFRYTAEQILFLKAAYKVFPAHRLTLVFNVYFGLEKTEDQIRSTLKNHRITCGREPMDRTIRRFKVFAPKQAQFLRNNYTGRSVAELTDLFNDRFGTCRTQRQIKTFVHNRGITSGRTGRFEKGHSSWNIGTKGLTAANKTSFKKGNVPPNRKPLGHERICPKDGYILIKVAERNPNTGFPTSYKHKHVHIYEQEHGPVPKGMVVAFRDSDKLNIDPGNLMLISRAELARLNKHGYKNTPADIKPSVLTLAKLEVKIYSVQREEKHHENNTV